MYKETQQIAFVTLNGFCPLSNTPPPHTHTPSPGLITDNINMDKIPTKIK